VNKAGLSGLWVARMNAGFGYPDGVRPVRQPGTGDLIKLTAAASVQFGGSCALLFRVIRVDRRPTYAGWVWLIGYGVDERGNAIERREVFVQIAGLIYLTSPGGSSHAGSDAVG
jgi:hypothetical protein